MKEPVQYQSIDPCNRMTEQERMAAIAVQFALHMRLHSELKLVELKQ